MPVVKVYSSPTCPHCQRTKKFLQENDIDFEDYDVTSDQAKAEEMMDKSGQMGVPVIEVDNEIITGFDEEKLKKALDL
ncbi:MAG: NrdH-redoxin [Candidatus Omnitrophica bacterium]|nr:NrdH-redoxin [Candidatus Omnitrophota bacterium]